MLHSLHTSLPANRLGRIALCSLASGGQGAVTLYGPLP
jgi:hypothetical protein